MVGARGFEPLTFSVSRIGRASSLPACVRRDARARPEAGRVTSDGSVLFATGQCTVGDHIVDWPAGISVSIKVEVTHLPPTVVFTSIGAKNGTILGGPVFGPALLLSASLRPMDPIDEDADLRANLADLAPGALPVVPTDVVDMSESPRSDPGA
jgi:hypothetical protein